MDRPEPTLTDSKATIEVLQKYGFSFQKKFGQNFLIDPHALSKIVVAADISEDDFVIEIGPGIGTLTQQLAYRAREVYAVEIDGRLLPVLDETLSGYDNVRIINDDVMKVDLRALVQDKNGGKPAKVVANLPYYITTPVIMGLFENHVPMERAVVMVQREVADRMRALPGTKDYGALSLAVQYYASAKLVANVPQNCFMPRPNVASAVVGLCTHCEAPVEVEDERFMFDIIKAAFGQRRKTLANALYNAEGLSVSKNDTGEALRRMGIAPDARGETLSLEQFARLSEQLKKYAGAADKTEVTV